MWDGQDSWSKVSLSRTNDQRWIYSLSITFIYFLVSRHTLLKRHEHGGNNQRMKVCPIAFEFRKNHPCTQCKSHAKVYGVLVDTRKSMDNFQCLDWIARCPIWIKLQVRQNSIQNSKPELDSEFMRGLNEDYSSLWVIKITLPIVSTNEPKFVRVL